MIIIASPPWISLLISNQWQNLVYLTSLIFLKSSSSFWSLQLCSWYRPPTSLHYCNRCQDLSFMYFPDLHFALNYRNMKSLSVPRKCHKRNICFMHVSLCFFFFSVPSLYSPHPNKYYTLHVRWWLNLGWEF